MPRDDVGICVISSPAAHRYVAFLIRSPVRNRETYCAFPGCLSNKQRALRVIAYENLGFPARALYTKDIIYASQATSGQVLRSGFEFLIAGWGAITRGA